MFSSNNVISCQGSTITSFQLCQKTDFFLMYGSIYHVSMISCKVCLSNIQQPWSVPHKNICEAISWQKLSQTGPGPSLLLSPVMYSYFQWYHNHIYQMESQVSVFLTEYAVDLLYAFANCSGLDLIFGLNALLRTSENTWDSSNAELLLKYCESRQYVMSWELGNGRLWDISFWLGLTFIWLFVII